MEVIAQLNLRDTRAVALSCRAGWNITRVQLMWKQKLWLRAKVLIGVDIVINNPCTVLPILKDFV